MEVAQAVKFPELFGRSVSASPESGVDVSCAAADGIIDEAEFVSLLERARGKLWVIAAAVLSDRTEADDVVQEATIIGLAKRSGFCRGSSFEGWMGQITRHVALNAARKRHRRFVRVEGLQMAAGAEFGGRVGGLSPGLSEALGELDPVARECLVFRVVGGLSYQAISQILGIPEGTAMSHVHRSRQRLRGRLLSIASQVPDAGDGAST